MKDSAAHRHVKCARCGGWFDPEDITIDFAFNPRCPVCWEAFKAAWAEKQEDLGSSSSCWDCGETFPVDPLYAGKRSGAALCESCLAQWVKAGRATWSGGF